MKKRGVSQLGIEDFRELGFRVDETPKAKGFRKASRKTGAIFAFIAASALVGTVLSVPAVTTVAVGARTVEPVAEFWKEIPSELPPIAIGLRNTIFDKDGVIIGETWTEDRIPLKSLEDISPHAINALIATEDRTFYENSGFNAQGIIRSAVKGSGGGSGITQQLVKNLLFYNLLGKENQGEAVERSYMRKLRELKLAINYENSHTKDEILLEYFNTVAFGGPNIYGIETASRFFYGKSAKALSVAEASALVGTAQNPSIYNMNDPEKTKAWKARQAEVLGRMVAENHFSLDDAAKLEKENLNLVKKQTRGGNCYNTKYPFYCKYTMDYLSRSPRLGETQEERDAIIAKGGLQIKTYMDSKAMDQMEAYMKQNWGITNRVIAPTAVVQPGTGGVVAIASNRDIGFSKGETDLILPAMPAGEGSAYKLFTLAAALNTGMTESDLTFSSQCPLNPGRNYDSPPGGFRNSNSCELQGGTLNYKQATAYSSNTWYVTLEMKATVNEVKKFSRSVGLAAPDNITNRSLSYTLGSVGNSPINVAAAFATFANKGVYCPATPIDSLTYLDGSEPAMPDTYNPEEAMCRSVMSPHNAGIVLKAMRANISGEVPGAFGLQSNIPGFDTAAKSGTNEGLNSVWAHLSSQYSVYTNVYDMEKTTRGIAGARFRGTTHGNANTAQMTGTDLMKMLLSGKSNVPMDYDNTDTNFTPAPVNQSNFFTIPNVLGVEPGQALGIMNGVGVKAHVSKEIKDAPAGYPSGVVIEQSIAPGERLAKGTRKEIVLTVSR